MTNTSQFAIVDSSSRIVSLHETRESGDAAGWGHDRELVCLVAPHAVGDVIEYDETGTETIETSTDRNEQAWWSWHDADSSRWSEDTETAEARCAGWVAGNSDDGPE